MVGPLHAVLQLYTFENHVYFDKATCLAYYSNYDWVSFFNEGHRTPFHVPYHQPQM